MRLELCQILNLSIKASALLVVIFALLFSGQLACCLSASAHERHALTIQEIGTRLKKNPKDPVALLARAKVRTQAHSISLAIEDFEAVLKMQPMNREALEDVSKLNLSAHRWKAAVSNFNALEKLTPHPNVFSDGGDAKFQVKDYDGAAHDWKEASRMNPDMVAYTERAGYGSLLEGQWLAGAENFEKAFDSSKTSWPLADAAFALTGYGLAGKKEKQVALLQKIATKRPVDMDLFDGYVIDYMSGKIDADTLAKKRGEDPYYIAQSNFFIGFDLAGKGKIKEALPYLEKCDMTNWGATDDFKFPLEAIAKRYVARVKKQSH
jgi:tetratricopeptide (TPR) repeat protein